jgi:H+-transporting ATPase
MDNIGTSLLVLVLFWILAAWIGGFFRNIGITEPGSQNLLHYALILLIIGVPVGLPVVTTTTLAVGAAYLAKQRAIVQKLTAIESLAVSLYFSFPSPGSSGVQKTNRVDRRAWTFFAPTRLAH